MRPGRSARVRTPGSRARDGQSSRGSRGGLRWSPAEDTRRATVGASARREVTAPRPRESRLSEPFQRAHNKCARHRMHHLPPQICALMGRQIAVRGGHAGSPVPSPPACRPAGATRVC
ncbi:uncharacterized protein LOC143646022 [Tamandua tetradactyla]|uniref:uncharacterized protein LOC143646022 n=1 Tax=Tamandua tetradactyla TaxID=48850 RepID=UPI00405413C4